MENRLVSVCIPVYNGEKFLAKTIRSVMNQTYKNIEIIISNNASTDGTINIVNTLIKEDNRIVLNNNEENLGFSGNLNKLIGLSNSEYIAIYHADDIYDKKIIEEQINYLQKNSKLAGCFTLAKLINEKDELLKNNLFLREENTKNNKIINLDEYISNIFRYGGSTFICPTSMIKKTVYEEIGNYDTTLKYIEDQDMYLRILEKYNMGIVAKELVCYRIHIDQVSNYYKRAERNELVAHAVHIENYLNKNNSLKIKYTNELNNFISKNYLNLVKKNINKGNKYNIEKYIKLSKKYYTFTSFSKTWLLQNSDNIVVYTLVKVLLFFKEKLCKL